MLLKTLNRVYKKYLIIIYFMNESLDEICKNELFFIWYFVLVFYVVIFIIIYVWLCFTITNQKLETILLITGSKHILMQQCTEVTKDKMYNG